MIPLKIETLLSGRVVEHDSIEYKAGWNPNDTICSICAFANDYDNTNGGYVVIGVEEKDGMPVLPPVGVPKEGLDTIQKELFQYCNQIVPRYIPKMEVVNYRESGVYLIYLWCTAGDSGPYQSPKNVYVEKGEKADKNMRYWIRPASLTVEARRDELAELFDKFNSVPFDDRINRKATIDDIRRGHLEDFIKKSNSALVQEINTSSTEGLLLAEEVANETDTELNIRNIGVLMFAERPDKFIPGACIELIRFNTKEAEPVEIRIYVDSIQILNYPGLAKWINLEKFTAGKLKGRKYRNRRIGELFKEIDLSEKKGTGIPKILRELKINGSPEPEFEMDDDRTYLNTIIYIRDGFERNEIMSESMSEIMSESMSKLEAARTKRILCYLEQLEFINSTKAAELLGVEVKTAGRLLSKAHKVGLLDSTGKTKNKVYRKK